MAALYLPGPVLVGPDEERTGAWVLDGRITYDAPSGADLVDGLRAVTSVLDNLNRVSD